MFKRGLGWSLAIVIGMTACGESSSSEDDAALALEDVPEAYARTLCNAFLTCNPLITSLLPEANCVELFEKTLANQGFSQIVDAIEDGRATYDGRLMKSCLDTLSGRSCDNIDDREPDSCDEAVRGTVARGDDCTTDVECEGDSICNFQDACPGTCAPKLNAGDVCSSDDQCKEGLECSSDTGRCVEPAAEGDDCEGGVAPVCAGSTLTCLGADDETGTAGTCTPNDEVFTAEVGEACSIEAGPWCVEGAACVVLELTADGANFECMEVAADGEACSFGLPNPCKPGSFCGDLDLASLDFEGTCQPTLEPGDECASDQLFVCGFGAACVVGDDSVGHCLAKKANGVSCSESAECWSENCTDGGCAPTSACN